MIEERACDKTVEVVHKPGLGYAAPAILLTFSMLCILIWANLSGLLGAGGGLIIGCVQLGAFAPFLASAILLFKKGLSFEANIFMIFNGMFCGVGAAFNITTAIADRAGVSYSSRVMGIVWLVCGIYLLCMLSSVRKTPAANFLSFLFCGVSLIALGLVFLDVLTGGWTAFAAWTMLASGLCALLMSISGISGMAGVHIPAGPPLFK